MTPIIETLIPGHKADEVAHAIAKHFCKAHEGNKYLVPRLSRAQKIERDKKIVEESTKKSVARLANKYDLTDGTIREILKEGGMVFNFDLRRWEKRDE